MENQKLNVRFAKLLESAPDFKLDEYLGLINTKYEKSSITFKKAWDYIYLKFVFNKKKYVEISDLIRKNYIGLPMEINSIIADFILEDNIIDINVVQFYPNLYPYFRPFVDLISIKKNFNTNIDVEILYKLICDKHNQKAWNAEIMIDKDILDLYIDFNKINYLLQN